MQLRQYPDAPVLKGKTCLECGRTLNQKADCRRHMTNSCKLPFSYEGRDKERCLYLPGGSIAGSVDYNSIQPTIAWLQQMQQSLQQHPLSGAAAGFCEVFCSAVVAAKQRSDSAAAPLVVQVPQLQGKTALEVLELIQQHQENPDFLRTGLMVLKAGGNPASSSTPDVLTSYLQLDMNSAAQQHMRFAPDSSDIQRPVKLLGDELMVQQHNALSATTQFKQDSDDVFAQADITSYKLQSPDSAPAGMRFSVQFQWVAQRLALAHLNLWHTLITVMEPRLRSMQQEALADEIKSQLPTAAERYALQLVTDWIEQQIADRQSHPLPDEAAAFAACLPQVPIIYLEALLSAAPAGIIRSLYAPSIDLRHAVAAAAACSGQCEQVPVISSLPATLRSLPEGVRMPEVFVDETDVDSATKVEFSQITQQDREAWPVCPSTLAWAGDGLRDEAMLGITVGVGIMSATGTSAFAHVEDGNMYSSNWNMHGASKVWYACPPSSTQQLIKTVHNSMKVPDVSAAAAHCMSKTMLPLMHASSMQSLGVCQYTQEPGDLVITAPGAMHWTLSLGFNFAESGNFFCPLPVSSQPAAQTAADNLLEQLNDVAATAAAPQQMAEGIGQVLAAHEAALCINAAAAGVGSELRGRAFGLKSVWLAYVATLWQAYAGGSHDMVDRMRDRVTDVIKPVYRGLLASGAQVKVPSRVEQEFGMSCPTG